MVIYYSTAGKFSNLGVDGRSFITVANLTNVGIKFKLAFVMEEVEILMQVYALVCT